MINFCLTVLTGTAGGALLALAGFPAAWLTGAMMAVAVAAGLGLPMRVPDWIRTIVFVVLGTSIGSAVTPGTIAEIAAWPGSLAILAVAVVVMIGASTTYLTRVWKWEAATARYSSIPGALSQVLVMALRGGADLPRIAFAQSLRLFVLVALMPWLLPGADHAVPVTTDIQLSLLEAAGVLAAGWVVGVALDRVGVPAGGLLGGILVSAAVHAIGVVEGRLPGPLLIIGFVVTGCVIGCRFGNASFSSLRGAFRGALESVLLALGVSALFAFAAHWLLDLPFGQVWLAYAPGGVEAMTIMAFALGLDPAFVGAHHVVRLIVLNVFVPLWLRRLSVKDKGKTGTP
ncbi:ammonia monooxygenase [Skermanella stibiiresistens SB22]|uniref:Ammonia monooxygenase n=1 Tax=Skermanella stibiiresistens SB22 TaxID=1385369 RepID=W9H1E8_9PROT|nr:AbrB family transcriptional regulator [Skermanella stibiiresistens]EWY40010.1 ammonia monooxygenase [Skermanella stibiiresistens SB22]